MLPGTGYAYLDLANTYLLIRAKVVRGDGTDLAADTQVAPVNNWLHSLFSQVDVYINDTLVTPSSDTYPFRSYVETLLSYGAEAKKTQLTSQLWYKDTAGHMHATLDNGGNAGLAERRKYIAESRVVEMMVRLHVDLFLQDRFLLNGVSITIRLVRSKDTFSLMADGVNPDFKVPSSNMLPLPTKQQPCSFRKHTRIVIPSSNCPVSRLLAIPRASTTALHPL